MLINFKDILLYFKSIGRHGENIIIEDSGEEII